MPTIVTFPSSLLKKKAELVTVFDDTVSKLVAEMVSVMDGIDTGVGLAAPQVGVLKQVIVMREHWRKDRVDHVLINPEIVSSSEEKMTYKEGCLSHPGIYVNITRPANVTVKFQTIDGTTLQETYKSTGKINAAAIIQHEIDHLNGVNIIDKISPGQLLMLQRKLDKLRKAAYR